MGDTEKVAESLHKFTGETRDSWPNAARLSRTRPEAGAMDDIVDRPRPGGDRFAIPGGKRQGPQQQRQSRDAEGRKPTAAIPPDFKASHTSLPSSTCRCHSQWLGGGVMANDEALKPA
jgi:hypothetical protein